MDNQNREASASCNTTYRSSQAPINQGIVMPAEGTGHHTQITQQCHASTALATFPTQFQTFKTVV
jgi:hypothetical protein